MALTDLLKAGKKELRGENEFIDIIVHPGWTAYFNSKHPPTWGDLPFCGQEKDLFNKASSLIENYPTRGPNLYWLGDDKPIKKRTARSMGQRKSDTLYLTGCSHLHQLTEMLLEAHSLKSIQGAYVFVIPKGGLVYEEYKTFLSWASDNHGQGYFVESQKFNNGNLLPESNKRPGLISRFFSGKQNMKVDALKRLAHAQGVRHVRVWGGYINQCLNHTEEAVQASGLDYSVCLYPSQTSLTSLGMVYLPQDHFSENYDLSRLAQTMDAWRKSPPDISNVTNGKSWQAMLEGIMSIPGWIPHTIEVKKAVAYRHRHLAYNSIAE